MTTTIYTIVLVSAIFAAFLFILLLKWFNNSIERRCFEKIEEMMVEYKRADEIASIEKMNIVIADAELKKRNSFVPPSPFDGPLFE
jgi:hypothetical protein